jgi:hypothetical protein
MSWVGWFSKKKLAVIAVALIILAEVYAQSYVPIHALSVVPDSQAKAGWGEGGPGGSYEFVASNCRWIVKWVRENPSESSPHDGYVWTWIYIVSENTRILSSSTSMLVSGITAQYGTNASKVFYDIENNVLYENNRTDIRTNLFFTENGSCNMT